MYPHERSLVAKHKNDPFVILGVNSDDTPEKLRDAMQRNQITWPSFFDGGSTSGPIATRWGVRGWPTIYLIDKQGVLHSASRGDKELEAQIETLLAEK
jgi:peroxiredoxin